MPQIVKAHPAQAVALQEFWECRSQIIGPHPLAQLVHKYNAIILVIVTVAADLFIQLLRLFHLQKVFPEAANQRQYTQTGLGLGRMLFNFRLLPLCRSRRSFHICAIPRNYVSLVLDIASIFFSSSSILFS